MGDVGRTYQKSWNRNVQELVPFSLHRVGIARCVRSNVVPRSRRCRFLLSGTGVKKTVSLCKEAQSKYLLYRFGTKANIEFQYPANLDASSWKKFDFAGHHRGGGKANAGFGDYSRSFVTGKAEYVIFQEWDDEDEIYSIGINVQVNKKSISIHGDRNTQQGSLVTLERERKYLRNQLEN